MAIFIINFSLRIVRESVIRIMNFVEARDGRLVVLGFVLENEWGGREGVQGDVGG